MTENMTRVQEQNQIDDTYQDDTDRARAKDREKRRAERHREILDSWPPASWWKGE